MKKDPELDNTHIIFGKVQARLDLIESMVCSDVASSFIVENCYMDHNSDASTSQQQGPNRPNVPT